MNFTTFSERLRLLLRRAFEDQPIPTAPHFVDDSDLLERWAERELTANELDGIMVHLANCPECRQVVSDLIATGLLIVGDIEPPTFSDSMPPTSNREPRQVSSPQTVAMERNHKSNRGRGWLVAAALGSAAAAAAIVSLVARPPVVSFEDQFAELERLTITDAQQAFSRSAQLLRSSSYADKSERLRQVIADSATNVAQQALIQKEFERAHRAVTQAAELGVTSGRLMDLGLRANAGRINPTLLAMNDQLFGRYSLTGRSLKKSLTFSTSSREITQEEQRILDGYRQAVAEHPDSVELATSYGEWLLKVERHSEAETQFRMALQTQADHVAAHAGIGVALFEQGRHEPALAELVQAHQLAPRNNTITLNLAITLEASGRAADALPMWRELQTATTDEDLKRAIEQHLARM